MKEDRQPRAKGLYELAVEIVQGSGDDREGWYGAVEAYELAAGYLAVEGAMLTHDCDDPACPWHGDPANLMTVEQAKAEGL